ncbi:cyclin-domain-containing protein, partial [Gloeopeniophorella convolvens]
PARSVPAFNFHEVPTQDLLRLVADLLTQVAEANMRPEEDRRPMTPPPKLPATEDWERNSRTSIWPSLLTASRKALCMPYPAYSFQARNIPQITIESYLYRILKYCPTTNEVFISLLVYFDRMAHISKEATGSHLFIDKHNIHRLIIAGVTVASKFFSDVFYTNSRYAKVGGLPQHELNQLELQFLVLNDFRLTISTEEMQRY